MQELLLILSVLILTALWTVIDRRFPVMRTPIIYREVLWQNILTNFVLTTVIAAIIWYVVL